MILRRITRCEVMISSKTDCSAIFLPNSGYRGTIPCAAGGRGADMSAPRTPPSVQFDRSAGFYLPSPGSSGQSRPYHLVWKLSPQQEWLDPYSFGKTGGRNADEVPPTVNVSWNHGRCPRPLLSQAAGSRRAKTGPQGFGPAKAGQPGFH